MSKRLRLNANCESFVDELLKYKELTHTEWYFTEDECNSIINSAYPIIDRAFLAMLEGMNLDVIENYQLGDFTYDCAILSQHVVIVFAHNLTHSYEIDVRDMLRGRYKTGRSRHYHKELALNAQKYDYECVHIFDWDDALKVALSFMPKMHVPLSQCKIQQVSEEESYLFLDMYHARNHSDTAFDSGFARLGLYHDDDLIYLLTVGHPKYDKSYTAEIYRLCSNPEYDVIGGWKQLFDCFTELYKPESVIALRDIAKMYWYPYLSAGMQLRGYTEPRKYWAKGSERLTDGARFVNQLKVKRNKDYSTQTQNLNTMLQLGWLPIYDCSSAIYEWRRTQS